MASLLSLGNMLPTATSIWATGYCNGVGEGVEMVKKRQ